MADDAENPDPSAAVSTTEHQGNAGPAPSHTTQATYATVRARRGSQGMTKLIGKDDLKDVKKLLIMASAEFMGTLFLVFLGVLACVEVPGEDGRIIAIALVFGLAVATIAQMLGHVSGAHLNPAVSFGLVAAGECGLIKAGIYFLAQLFGAIFGALFAFFFTKKQGVDLQAHLIISSLSVTKLYEWQALFIEMFITFPLIFVILAVCDKGNNMKGSAALAIGLAIALGHLVAIESTGASMNPTRSLGPLIITMGINGGGAALAKQIWVYLFGPILGGVLAGVLYRFVYSFEKMGISNDSDGEKKEGQEDKTIQESG